MDSDFVTDDDDDDEEAEEVSIEACMHRIFFPTRKAKARHFLFFLCML